MRNPAVYIIRQPSAPTPGLGQSRLWGYPDLPVGIDVPSVEEDGEKYALTLIAQINLADIRHPALPKEGLLQFYADIAYYLGQWDEPAIAMHVSDTQVCRVLYIPPEQMPLLQNARQRYYEQDELPTVPITFSRQKPPLSEPELQLLGKTDHLEWRSWPRPYGSWRLLLQVDSMDLPGGSELRFMDCGVLCFIISPADLASRRFTNVRAIILST